MAVGNKGLPFLFATSMHLLFQLFWLYDECSHLELIKKHNSHIKQNIFYVDLLAIDACRKRNWKWKKFQPAIKPSGTAYIQCICNNSPDYLHTIFYGWIYIVPTAKVVREIKKKNPGGATHVLFNLPLWNKIRKSALLFCSNG